MHQSVLRRHTRVRRHCWPCALVHHGSADGWETVGNRSSGWLSLMWPSPQRPLPPRLETGEQTETSGQRFERRYVSTREAGTVHTSGMRERRAAILGDRCFLGPECCGSASLLRPTLSFAMVLPAASDTASQVVTLARAQHQTWTQRRMGRCRRLPRRRGDVDVWSTAMKRQLPHGALSLPAVRRP